MTHTLHSLAHAIDGVDIEDVSCNVLNMEFFDRLWIKGLVRDTGEMVKSKKDRWGDVPCEDEVRKVSFGLIRLRKYSSVYVVMLCVCVCA